MEICKIAFFCEYQYSGFFKSQQIFSGALEFSFVFKFLLKRLKNTVLSEKVKNDFFGRKMPFFDQKLRFMRIFQFTQLNPRNSSFKQNGLFLQQKSFRNPILIKLKYCLSIMEIFDFALL